MIMLFMFTFVTMVGGNPLKDVYGFRYWTEPGPVSQYYGTGPSAGLRSFTAALLGAAFAVAGPDMLSLIVSRLGAIYRVSEFDTWPLLVFAVCRSYQPSQSLARRFQERLCPSHHLVSRLQPHLVAVPVSRA